VAASGVAPVWSRDGKELVFRSGDRLMAATVSPTGSGITIGDPLLLATAPPRDGFSLAFDLATDGRVLMTHTTGGDHIAIVLNWPAELQRIEKVGIGR